MATFTASAYNRQPVASPLGLNAVTFVYSSGANVFGSVGDTILLAKLPLPCTLVSFLIRGVPAASSGSAVQMSLFATGGSESSSATLAVLRPTLSTSFAFGMLGPSGAFMFDTLPADDTVQPQHAVLKFACTSSAASITTSYSVSGMIMYTTHARK